jgi:hypothetical protein
MATDRSGTPGSPSPVARGLRVVIGVALVVVGIWSCFAGAVIAVLALTDVSGFRSNVSSIALLVLLVGSGLALGVIGLRLLRRRRAP